MDEIEKAWIAHKSIAADLKSSKIILSHTKEKILNTITTENFNRSSSKIDNINFTLISDAEREEFEELVNQWSLGGHHELLMEILEKKIIPKDWHEKRHIGHPPTLKYAQERALGIGHRVPQKYIKEDRNSYSENEAYHAAQMIVRGDCRFLDSINFLNLRGFLKHRFRQLTGQFIIPDPTDPKKTPYFIDQLWIASEPNPKNINDKATNIRLICLEIDGEPHLTKESQKKQEYRDFKLNEMGYEVYHLAGWWCRIDPYKAICAFLSEAGLVPNIDNDFSFSIFSISDYICNHCEKPMVRWDVDWIQVVENEFGKKEFLHKLCANEISYH